MGLLLGRIFPIWVTFVQKRPNSANAGVPKCEKRSGVVGEWDGTPEILLGDVLCKRTYFDSGPLGLLRIKTCAVNSQ